MKELHSDDTPHIGPEKLGDGPSKEITFVPAEGQLDALMGLAVIDEVGDPAVTLADELRGALSAYVQARHGSPTYEAELRQASENQGRALSMLNRE